VNWNGPVPVQVYRGSLEDARIEAFNQNSKDKLPMSPRDKMEGAWTLAKEGKETVSRIVDITQRSERQIYYMRSVWKKLNELPKDHLPDKKPADLSWTQARAVVNDDPIDFDEEKWVDKQAQKLVDALLKAKIGQGLAKRPDVTAMALAQLDADLPRVLVWEWFDANELQEMINELGQIEL
jgi:hypothetical protein